jgi:hypothetical protein
LLTFEINVKEVFAAYYGQVPEIFEIIGIRDSSKGVAYLLHSTHITDDDTSHALIPPQNCIDVTFTAGGMLQNQLFETLSTEVDVLFSQLFNIAESNDGKGQTVLFLLEV